MLPSIRLGMRDESLLISLVVAVSSFVGSFALAVVVSTLRRIRRGLTLGELARTGAREVVPIRALVIIMHWVNTIVFTASVVGAIAAVGNLVFRLIDGKRLDGGVVVLSIIVPLLAVAAHFVRRMWKQRVVGAERGDPPRVDCSLVPGEGRISPRELTTLGYERFPSPRRPGWRTGLVARVLIMVALPIGACAFAVASLPESRMDAVIGVTREISRFSAPAPIAVAVLWTTGVLLLVLLFADRHYLVVPFRSRIAICAVLAPVAFWASIALDRENGGAVFLVILSLIVARRMFVDLRLARRAVRVGRACAPVSATIAARFGMLSRLAADPGCALPELDVDERARRVSMGADRLEEASVLVTRRFGRYLDVGTIDAVRCDFAAMRVMTVDRWVVVLPGWGTSRLLGGLAVPMWDESLFPLRAPEGFVHRDDPLSLGPHWNIVLSCGSCSGRGWVDQQESYTEYENGRSVTKYRTVRRICSTCGGSGRTEHPRVLVTGWRRASPAVVSPELGTPELVEDAAERLFVQQRFIEDRVQIEEPPVISVVDPALRAETRAATEAIVLGHGEHCERIASAIGGRVYRADFVVGAFHTVRIRFGGAGGRSGWFFGARPEFYFPRLPLSWAFLATVVALPPTVVALAVLLAAAMSKSHG